MRNGPGEWRIICWIRAIAARWLIVVGMIAVIAFGFAFLASEVMESETVRFDDAVRSWVMLHHRPALDALFTLLSWLGSSVRLAPLAGVVAILLWRRSGLRTAAATVVAPPGALILIEGLKMAFRRTRPAGALGYTNLGYSFPSGHSAGSMAIALTVAYVLVRERLAPAWALVAAFAFSLLVGLSRIYLDVHWATDVIGGWAVGLIVATGCAALYEWLRADASGRR